MPPACTIPETVGHAKKASLVICNLQDTPLDELAATRVYARTDELMVLVMEKLGLSIPAFVLRRSLVVRGVVGPRGKLRVSVCGVDVDGTPASFLRSVRCVNNRRVVRSEPFDIDIRGQAEAGTKVELELQFMGHYGEPNLEIVFDYKGQANEEAIYGLDYNPITGQWDVRLA